MMTDSELAVRIVERACAIAYIEDSKDSHVIWRDWLLEHAGWLDADRWRAFKCKPETIEAIHWAAGGLGVSVIKSTAYNVLENHPRCTPELIKELLLEEFNETEIDIAWHVVMRVSARINEEVEVREKVFDLYAQTGLDFASDPPAVMRALSPHLPKNMMQYAYALLVGLKS